MRAHDGLLAVALLFVAIAVGCQKSDSEQETSRGDNRQTPEVADHEPQPRQTAAGQAQSDLETAAPQDPTDQEEQPATAELKRARQELADLAEGAISLRAALLGAEFKNVQPSGTAPDSDSDAADEETQP
jgi:hypothetical protein